MIRPLQDIEIYCIVCHAQLRYFYGWFCPIQFPTLDAPGDTRRGAIVPQQEPGRKRAPWPGEA